MNFLSFEYFLAVSKAGSIRAAAAMLSISPQALSEQIRRLEAELDVKLLADTRPATLTPCGKHFAVYAAEMLSARKKLTRELSELAGRKKELVISISSKNLPPFLTDTVARFTAAYPDCMVTLKNRSENCTPEELKQYDLHISSEVLSRDLEHFTVKIPQGISDPASINSNRLAIAIHSKLLRSKWGSGYAEQVAKALETPALTWFEDVPFIRCDDQHDATVIERIFIKSGFSPKVVASASSTDVSMMLCCSGAGALIAPEGWIRRKIGGQQDILLFPLEEPYPPIDLIVSYEKGKTLTPPEQQFISMFVNSLPSEPGPVKTTKNNP